MMINIFTRTFLSPCYLNGEKNQINLYGTRIIRIKDRPELDNIEFFRYLIKTSSELDPNPSFIIFMTDDYFSILQRYIRLIGAKKEMLDIWLSHHKKYFDMWKYAVDVNEEKYSSFDEYTLSLLRFASNSEIPVIPEDIVKDLPAEYLGSIIDTCEIARVKLQYLAICDILYEVTHDMLRLFNDQDRDDSAKKRYNIFFNSLSRFWVNNTKRFIESMLANQTFYVDIIQNAYNSIGIEKDLSIYLDLNRYKYTHSDRGFSDLGILKYNSLLSDYVLKSGYKIMVKG